MPDPRLRDVAERAAVSMTTASIVLRRLPGARISPETRARVDRAAAEIGYQPRGRHRAVRLIALTMDPAGGRENVLFLAAAVEAASRRDRLVVLLPERDDRPGDGRPALDPGQLPLDGHVQVDGGDSAKPPSELAGHVVSVRLRPGSVPSSGSGISVVPDDRGAACALAPILAGAGHRQVAIVAGEGEAAVARCWQEGLASALGASRSRLVLVGDAPANGGVSEGRTEREGLEREVTVLVCMSAAAASKARALASAGHLSVARDVVVLVRGSQDDGIVAGDVTWLPLPTAEMARLTMAAALDERTDDPRPPAEDHVLVVAPFPLPSGLTIAPMPAGVVADEEAHARPDVSEAPSPRAGRSPEPGGPPRHRTTDT